MEQSVIYKITSPTGKVYIGQAVDYPKRYNKYKNLNCKAQPKLYNSLVKYGFEAHSIEIIEECTLENLNEREAFYIEQFQSVEHGLNLKYGGRGHKYSQESIEKMRKSLTGKKLSEETKRKMSESRKGIHAGSKHPLYGRTKELNPFFGKKHNDETKALMSDLKKGCKAPKFKGYIVAYKDGLQIGRYEGLVDAANHTGVDHRHIHKVVSGKQKQSKGYTFIREPLLPAYSA